MISGEVLKYLKGEHVVIHQNRDQPQNRQVCLTMPLDGLNALRARLGPVFFYSRRWRIRGESSLWYIDVNSEQLSEAVELL